LPVLAGLIGLIVSRSLLPLNQLTAQLAMRQANHLQPIAIHHLPTELQPVVQQLNSLLALLAQALDDARNFSSDASHELRTPLAGLLIQIQVADKTDDPHTRHLALQKAQQAVLRMTQRVQHLLTLSRLQHLSDSCDQQPCNIHALLIQMIAECDAAAHDKTIELVLISQPIGDWPVNPALCQIMLRNLVGNAIHYSPVGSTVQLRASIDQHQLTLSIDDSGPGVAEADLPRLTQRFYRGIDSAATVEGSGLGLAIVQRIVELHHGQLQFGRSPLGGLSARIILPAVFTPSLRGSDLGPDMV
jgi:two-component system sensor histidine kinase QseC